MNTIETLQHKRLRLVISHEAQIAVLDALISEFAQQSSQDAAGATTFPVAAGAPQRPLPATPVTPVVRLPVVAPKPAPRATKAALIPPGNESSLKQLVYEACGTLPEPFTVKSIVATLPREAYERESSVSAVLTRMRESGDIKQAGKDGQLTLWTRARVFNIPRSTPVVERRPIAAE